MASIITLSTKLATTLSAMREPFRISWGTSNTCNLRWKEFLWRAKAKRQAMSIQHLSFFSEAVGKITAMVTPPGCPNSTSRSLREIWEPSKQPTRTACLNHKRMCQRTRPQFRAQISMRAHRIFMGLPKWANPLAWAPPLKKTRGSTRRLWDFLTWAICSQTKKSD